MSGTFLKDQWEELAATIVPGPPGSVQWECMKQAFYGGVVVILKRLSELGEDGIPDDFSDSEMNKIVIELDEYAQTVYATAEAFKRQAEGRQHRS